jgi:hypothetical protein
MLVAQPGSSCGDLRGSTRSTYICASWMILIQAFHRSPTRNGEARARCRPLGFPPTRVMSAGARNDFIRHPDGHISLCDPGTSRGRIRSRHFNSRHPRAPSHAADAAAPRPKEKRRLESSTHHPGGLPCRLVRGQRGVGATSHLKAVGGRRSAGREVPPGPPGGEFEPPRVGPRLDLAAKIGLIRIRHIMEHFSAAFGTIGTGEAPICARRFAVGPARARCGLCAGALQAIRDHTSVRMVIPS